jgi:hypothetical protein
MARQLGQVLKLPVIHLDGLYYDQTWDVRPEVQFLALQQDATRGQGWVIDGNHLRSMPLRLAAADTVIFLDVSAVACLWGIACRRWRFRGGQHPAEGVYDRITPGYVRYVVGFNRRSRPPILALLAQASAHADVRVLRGRRSARRFLRGIPANHRALPGWTLADGRWPTASEGTPGD